MKRTELVKVWPLREGVRGRNNQGCSITLQPGVPGWMFPPEAEAAVQAGDVQIMVGLSVRDLKPIDLEASGPGAAAPSPPRKVYKRRDVTAEKSR